MPKKILFESAVYQVLRAAKRLCERLEATSPTDATRLRHWVNGLTFEDPGGRNLRIVWSAPQRGEQLVELASAQFCTRGDSESHSKNQAVAGLLFAADAIMDQNSALFDHELNAVLVRSGLFTEMEVNGWRADHKSARKLAEEDFHDKWAATGDVTKINVRQMNEACTAPEMRYVSAMLGDLKGSTLLDIGCGHGEASVYFAIQGAEVTAVDISPGMCDATRRLAEQNGAKLCTHVSDVEGCAFPDNNKYDIIYAGNLLHHVEIETTMLRLIKHLKPSGVFVSWDPVVYNPVINIYRRRAMHVRTADEHPLRLRDIRLVQSYFSKSQTRWFWLTTLLIFCVMAVVQRRDPNKERYWKKIVEEADGWAWLYRPLELLDRVLLTVPFLRPLCWNVVIVGRGPK